MPTKVALHPSTVLRTVSQTMDLARGTNGYFYLSNYRSAGNESGVWVLNDAGTSLWLSLPESRAVTGNVATNDLLKATGSIDVAPDGSLLAVGFADQPKVEVLSGSTLARLYAPATGDLRSGNLAAVAWTADAEPQLLAGGTAARAV